MGNGGNQSVAFKYLETHDAELESVYVEADKAVFQQYKSGVFDSTKCGTKLDHATLVVGYGTENGQDYWLMKNSWGTVWGEQGYMKLAIVDGEGICGIQMGPLYPSSN